MTNNLTANYMLKKAVLLWAVLCMMLPCFSSQTAPDDENGKAIAKASSPILTAQKINPYTIEIIFSDKQRMTLDFYGENIFRLFQDKNGGILRDPQAEPEARILVENPRQPLASLEVSDEN